jgi:uncharacterized protein YjbJ (UPF0337 family)
MVAGKCQGTQKVSGENTQNRNDMAAEALNQEPRNMNRGHTMDKDRIQGSFEQAKGKVKEVAGKASGDSKLEAEGKTQQVAGKVQNTIGGIKDSVKEATE